MEQMKVAERVMRKDRELLKKLAEISSGEGAGSTQPKDANTP